MGRSAKAELLRISLAVAGSLETMKRVRPTEKDMRGRAWRERAREERMRWAVVDERARRMPGGPGMERRGERERAHAMPPGVK